MSEEFIWFIFYQFLSRNHWDFDVFWNEEEAQRAYKRELISYCNSDVSLKLFEAPRPKNDHEWSSLIISIGPSGIGLKNAVEL